jgi:endonuclease/exonuclease/phosphatase family metal-dependent hydrolase
VPAQKIPGTIRFLTLNLWGENGPWQARLDLLIDQLGALAPDVIGLQEVREVSGRVPNHAAEIARRCGLSHHVFAPSTAWGGGHEGLAIVSRFPIGAHEAQPLPHSTESEGRILLSARIDADAARAGSFWVHTTHLSFRETEGRKREDQVLFVDAAVAAHANDHVQIVMGDFNTVPDADEIRWLTGLATLDGRRVFYQDTWARAHRGEAATGVTWTRANGYIDGMHWLTPERRLDYIFTTQVRRDRRGTVHGAEVVFDQPRVAPDGARLFVSDHFGVVADVQMVAEPGHAAK